MKKILSLLLIAALLAGCFAFAEAESLPEKDLIILYTGDVHCAVDKGWGYHTKKRGRSAIGKYALTVDPGSGFVSRFCNVRCVTIILEY